MLFSIAAKRLSSVMHNSIKSGSPLPLFLEGKVVAGFGRGSKQLGIPTANFDDEVVRSLPKNLKTGVYYGWAQLDYTTVYKMVANVGWSPFFQNTQMTVETHILKKFDEDFYGSHLKICLVGYLREESNFATLDDLIAAIKKDIENADEQLNALEALVLKNNEFFLQKIK